MRLSSAVFTGLLAGLCALASMGCEKGSVSNVRPATQETSGLAPSPSASHPADATPIVGGPAIWKTGDGDTTLYLFGTMHLLPPDVQWRTPALNAAFDAAKAIYFETDINPDRKVLDPLIAEFGFYKSGDTLSAHLSPAQRQQVSDAATRLNVSMAQLDTMRPWLAANVLADQMIVTAGYDPQAGAERTLEPMAKAAGKDIRQLETVQSQIMVFPNLSEKVQISFLVEGVKQLKDEAGMLPRLARAWAEGNVADLEKLMLEQDLEDTPAVYDALIVKRNTDWTGQLDKLVRKEKGVFFVAVGAAHLVGKDSVLMMLATKGRKVERVQ